MQAGREHENQTTELMKRTQRTPSFVRAILFFQSFHNKTIYPSIWQLELVAVTLIVAKTINAENMYGR